MASSAYVTQAYQELLGRAPDAGGLKHYMGYSNPNEVRSSILGSAEYKARSAAPAAPAAPAASSNLQGFADTMAKQQAELLAKQKAEQEGLFGQYESRLQGQEALPDMYGRIRNELGIPGLNNTFQNIQGEIFNVKSLLDQLDENVTARGQGTMMTEAQRQRQIAAEGDPLRTSLGRLGTGLEPVAQALSGAQGELSTLLNLHAQQQNKEMAPIEMRINAVSDRFAREMTGFTSSKQTQLDALLDDIDRGRQLADREWELAQSLAAEERAYAQAKELARINSGGGGGGGVGSYLPARAPVVTPQASRASTSIPNIASFFGTASAPLKVSSGSSRILQPAGGVNLGSGGGKALQGGGYKLQGNLSSPANFRLSVR